jgi:hypothetical protein
MSRLPEPHPAKLELVRRRITVTAAAEAIGVTSPFLCAVLNRGRPSTSRIRAGLVDLLGMPGEQLFHDEGAPLAS